MIKSRTHHKLTKKRLGVGVRSAVTSAAGTLTKTTETTRQLSGVVASASEEASADVRPHRRARK
jgi:hypothetical protein